MDKKKLEEVARLYTNEELLTEYRISTVNVHEEPQVDVRKQWQEVLHMEILRRMTE